MKFLKTVKDRVLKMKQFGLRWGRRILFLVAVYALLFVSVFVWQMAAGMLRDPDADLVDNSPAGVAQRRTDNAAIIESVRQLVDRYRTPEYQRDAHSKPHGCVRATFDVFESQSVYNHGLFRNPGRYEAWVRFSNGTVPALADTKKDARGMAIKVMNVEGEQLLPSILAGKTQDFVMINSPAFFIRTIEGYRELERLSAQGKPFTYFFGEHYLNPFKWDLRELYLGLGTRTTAPNTPLSAQYFSMSPYKLGPHQIKYSAKACENYKAEFIDKDDPNFLRNGMSSLLRTQDACFQFMVQIRDPDARMPIQDTTVKWSEKDAPFIPVARIHIPKQEFDTPQQNAMCEAMSFNPWHGIQEHEPLGYINELRRDLYLHTAAYRRVRNGVEVAEPNSWCESLEQYCDAAEPATTQDIDVSETATELLPAESASSPSEAESSTNL